METLETFQHILIDLGQLLNSILINLASASTPTKLPREVQKHPDRLITLLIGPYLKNIINSCLSRNRHNLLNSKSRFSTTFPVLFHERVCTKT